MPLESLKTLQFSQFEKLVKAGFWHLDVANDFSLSWSDNIYIIHGLKPSDPIPSVEEAIKYFHPDDREKVQAYIDKALKTGKGYEFELRLIDANGTMKYVSSSAECKVDDSGNVTEIYGAFKDISEYKQREIELQSTQELLTLIMNNNPDYVFVKNEASEIVSANPAFLSLYPEDMQDKIIGYTTVENYNDEEAAAFIEQDKKALDVGFSEVFEALTFPSGDMRTLFTKKVRFKDMDGDKYLLGISRDVTELKNAEQKLIHANGQLEEFASIAAHDLQEPLRMVVSFANLLKEHHLDALEGDAKQFLTFCIDGATRMQNLVKDLLEYSRLKSEDMVYEHVDMGVVVERILKTMNTDIEAIGAKITYEELPEVAANETRLERVLQNLVQNAIKYRAKDGVPEIHISAQELTDKYKICVADNGIGIEEKYFDRIFKPFKRLHSRDEYEGSGIGLANCKKLVETMGGDIWVESEPNIGSKFYFTVLKNHETVVVS